MLIRFFKSSFYLQYIMLFAIAASLWARVYFAPCPLASTSQESVIFNLLNGLIGSDLLISSIIGFAILLVNAFLLNFILIRHELLPQNSLLGVLVFILLMSQSPAALSLNPILCAGLFIIPAFDRILSTYGKADPTQEVFSASFLLALASLFYFPAIILLLLLMLSFAIFGTFSIRILMVAIAGAFAVYLYLFMYYFLADKLEGQYYMYLDWFVTLPGFTMSAGTYQFVVWGMQFLLFIAAMIYSLAHLNEWNIIIRKKVLINIWFALLAIITLIYEGDNLLIAVLIIVIPVSVVVSGYLANRKRIPLLLELYILLLLLASILNNIFLSSC